MSVLMKLPDTVLEFDHRITEVYRMNSSVDYSMKLVVNYDLYNFKT